MGKTTYQLVQDFSHQQYLSMLFGVYAGIILCSYRGNPAVLCAAAMTSVFDPSLHPAAPMLLMSLAQKDSQVEKFRNGAGDGW